MMVQQLKKIIKKILMSNKLIYMFIIHTSSIGHMARVT